MRPTWAEVNLQAIRDNMKTTREIAGKNASVMAVVKADAYGHGAVEVSKTLSSTGVEMFGVATLEEALELRENGINEPVILLGGIQPDETDCVLENDFIPSVYLRSTIQDMQRVASRFKKEFRYHLKIDTGMSRLGFMKEDIDDIISLISGYDNLKLDGIFTHFSSADDQDITYTQQQISEFRDIVRKFNDAGYYPKYIHMANSAAIQRFPESISNLVRPGIMIYGASSFKGNGLKNVMSVKSRIIQTKVIKKGTPVSYGCGYRTGRKTNIAILPVGYADGYLRSLSNKAYVSLKNDIAPVIGAVCMDFTIIDITDIPNVGVGDEVVLFGDGKVSIEDVARWGNTIPYEIMTIVGKRVRKVFT